MKANVELRNLAQFLPNYAERFIKSNVDCTFSGSPHGNQMKEAVKLHSHVTKKAETARSRFKKSEVFDIVKEQLLTNFSIISQCRKYSQEYPETRKQLS